MKTKYQKRLTNRRYRRRVRHLVRQDDEHRFTYQDAGPVLSAILNNDWQDNRRLMHWQYPLLREYRTK